MATKTFNEARKNKADEFYTQLVDIKNEIDTYLEFNPAVFRDKVILCPCDNPYKSNFFKYFVQNFKKFGIKQLIATCYAAADNYDLVSILAESPSNDETIVDVPHKIVINEVPEGFTSAEDEPIDIERLISNVNNVISRLDGDGDFRSPEITRLRDEADFIITNPPFSLFRDFILWIKSAHKHFLVISNMNAITYKEIFPAIKDNKIWMGIGFGRSFSGFIVPDNYPLNGSEARIDKVGNRIVSTNNTIWLTNIEHGRRHQPLSLLTMEQNLKFSKHQKVRNLGTYDVYDNYDAIDVPFTDAIPADYPGIMGVPISFLHKYCPEQFEIVKFRKGDDNKDLTIRGRSPYFRILIRHKVLATQNNSDETFTMAA